MRGFKFQVSGFRFRVSGFGFQVSSFRFQVSSFTHYALRQSSIVNRHSSIVFTQSNLHDYLTCPRRFELRYLRHLNWPAVETAPVQEAERRMQLGSDFHRLVHQHALGLPVAGLTAAAAEQSPALAAMWHNYLAHRPPELAAPGVRLFPEVTLSTTLAGYRLTARYDLLAFLPGEPPRALIVDWKTNARRPPSAALRAHIQSRVYPFVLAMSGGALTGDPPDADHITLRYWFAAAPTEPETIPYSAARFQADRADLSALLAEIAAAKTFPLTSDERACRFCAYRSFCDRGDVAGPLDEFEEDLLAEELSLDWEQVSEIAY
ncbi:MAG: PD-(D/E)XK nuclease family protein [Caldilineae bacterium]|nr:MAG: PD-(D/E)XK nuclease family protein [Caldilineae bacterium]